MQQVLTKFKVLMLNSKRQIFQRLIGKEGQKIIKEGQKIIYKCLYKGSGRERREGDKEGEQERVKEKLDTVEARREGAERILERGK